MRKKRVVNNVLPKPEIEREFNTEDNKEYKVKAIVDSAMYSQQAND